MSGGPWRYRKSVDDLIAAAMAWPHSRDSADAFKAYFATVPKPERHGVISRRRLTYSIVRAEEAELCMYCWMPCPVCICGEMPDLSGTLGEATCIPVIVFHAEEFLRRSNTGHILAMLFNAPVAVEGIPEHHELWTAIPRLHPDAYACAPPPATPDAKPVQPAVLFPSADAKPIREVGATAAAEGKPLALLLMDGTWNQGNMLNKRLPPELPRVVVDVPKTYQSLFAPLREQTRSTGVSTLEATVLAVVDLAQSQGREGDAARITSESHRVMKLFVDLVRVQKHMPPAYPAETQAFLDKAHSPLAQYNSTRSRAFYDAIADAAAEQRQRAADAAARGEAVRDVMPPHMAYAPVLNYCYCCAVYVGWSRMDLHVRGDKHHDAFYKPGSTGWQPTGEINEKRRPRREAPRAPLSNTEGTVPEPLAC